MRIVAAVTSVEGISRILEHLGLPLPCQRDILAALLQQAVDGLREAPDKTAAPRCANVRAPGRQPSLAKEKS
jgi:hypothetical protein